MEASDGNLRTYASDGDSSAGRWLLIVRQSGGSADAASQFAFNAVVSVPHETSSDESKEPRHSLAESIVGADELTEQMDDLGLEMELNAFAELVAKALDARQCVNLAVEEQEEGKKALKVSVVVTYKFSDTISRKGCFDLPVTAEDIPAAVVSALSDLHRLPHKSILSEHQKVEQNRLQRAQRLSTTLPMRSSVDITSATAHPDVQKSQTNATATETSAEAPATSAQRLKRKHIPTGTARRRAPKGAKLSKR